MKTFPPSARRGAHRDLAKERSWRQRLSQFAGSGQSVRQFCAARGLKETAFYFWRNEIRRRDGESPSRRPTTSPVPRPVDFARVLVQPPQLGLQEGLRLRLGGERELLLPASMAPEQVARLIRAVEGLS